MSSSPALELQTLIFQQLKDSVTVGALIGDRIYDRVPQERLYPYVSFGTMQAVGDDAECIVAAEHTIQLDIWTREVGRKTAHNIADAIKRLLHDASLSLTDNALVFIQVNNVLVIPDSDGQAVHGILTITANIEEV